MRLHNPTAFSQGRCNVFVVGSRLMFESRESWTASGVLSGQEGPHSAKTNPTHKGAIKFIETSSQRQDGTIKQCSQEVITLIRCFSDMGYLF